MKKSKRNIILVFCVVLIIAFVCCAISIFHYNAKEYMLKVTDIMWYAPEECDTQVRELKARKDDIIQSISPGYEDVAFEIIKVSEKSITVKSNQPLSILKENKKINLDSNETEFVINRGEKIQLHTPTFDGGGCWEIEFE
mgnify:CR=1 FL=1